MAWLGPLLGLVGGGLGLGESIQNSSTAQDAATLQNNIAASQESLNQQAQAQKMKVMQALFPFFAQYLQQGSPFLSNIQGAAAGQNAQQFGNAAGQLRGSMQTSGLGYGPSGTTAAAIGELGRASAQDSAQNYLQNLLANEQIKFQAAQGQQGLGNMFNFGGQNMPTTQPVPTTTGSSVNALGQALQNLIGKKSPASPVPGRLPTTLPGGAPPPINPMPPPGSIPNSAGYNLGTNFG